MTEGKSLNISPGSPDEWMKDEWLRQAGKPMVMDPKVVFIKNVAKFNEDIESFKQNFMNSMEQLKLKKAEEEGKEEQMDGDEETVRLAMHAAETMQEWLPGYVYLGDGLAQIHEPQTQSHMDKVANATRITQEYVVETDNEPNRTYRVRIIVTRVM